YEEGGSSSPYVTQSNYETGVDVIHQSSSYIEYRLQNGIPGIIAHGFNFSSSMATGEILLSAFTGSFPAEDLELLTSDSYRSRIKKVITPTYAELITPITSSLIDSEYTHVYNRIDKANF